MLGSLAPGVECEMALRAAADQHLGSIWNLMFSTAHGLYKADPVLRVDRVRELRRLTDMPIVLHGGTGLADEDF
ncbi:MAG: class II fructose-bisphosphate aldolase, partial [Dermatophilaceae bacterium]